MPSDLNSARLKCFLSKFSNVMVIHFEKFHAVLPSAISWGMRLQIFTMLYEVDKNDFQMHRNL